MKDAGKKMKLVLGAGIAALFAAVLFARPLILFAANATSTDFIMQDAFVGMFGGSGSSTDFQSVNGSQFNANMQASSTDFTTDTGPVNFSTFTPESEIWRWYGDANDETPTSSLGAEDAAPSNIANQQIIKLRLAIAEKSGLIGGSAVKFGLQFSPTSDFSSGVTNVAEVQNCAATSTWCYATSTGGTDNAVISTALLSDSGSCVSGAGVGCGTHNTSAVSTSTASQTAGAVTEYEFTIKASGVSFGATYFFRAFNEDAGVPVPLDATSSYPSLVSQGATLTFSLNGLSQGVNTNGVTTSVSTTATGVPFSTLPLGSSLTAAQQLLVTTNAANGYELYVAENSPLMNQWGNAIPSVSGTNGSPLPWATGCAATSSGCYGYHAGSPVLAGGSTRFAVNDSYAAFTTSTAEVGYSALPVTSSTFTMVYQVAAGPTQVNGQYSHNIMYIVAPSF
jgi:hypothetical protein